jgi:hypothetical protein
MGAYLAVKVLWIGASLALHDTPSGWNTRDWVALNLATVGMATVGIAVGLGLAQDWGQRLPAPLVVTPLWLGSGFLVTMLPYSLLVSLFHAVDERASGSSGSGRASDLPGWESALLSLGFAGMGIGLLVGVPLYVRARWPWVFERAPAPAPSRRRVLGVLASVLLLGLTATHLGWAAGLDWGLRTGVQPVDVQDRLLLISSGAWSLVTSVALAVALRAADLARPVRALLLLGSGSLTAWGGWRLAVTWWDPPGLVRVELLPVAYAVQAAGVVAGLAVLAILLRVLPRPAR